jgi:enoyl-CoA hydratase
MQAWGDLEHLSVEREPDGIAGAVLVTLDLPDRRNAMSEAMTASWDAVMTVLRREQDLRVVVVTGRGRAFCAGGDFSWIGAKPGASVPELRERMLAFYGTWLSVRHLEVPTVAAVNGAAIGAGLAIALACDVRVVAQDARLAAPFTSLGLHPGMATTWLIRRAAGDTMARDMLLTGRALTGEEGAACGLMSRSVPTNEVLATSMDVARTVAAAAPVATRLTKAALGSGGPETFESALAWEAIAQPVTLAMEDLQEGIAAAQDKRPPRFTGR